MFNNFFNEKIKEFYPEQWQFGFQEPVTPVMEGIIRFHHDLFFFLTIILVFVIYMLVRCLLRFDKTKNPEPIIVTHAPTLEIIWTLIPAAILFVIAIPSFSLLYSMDYLPSPFLTFKVVGHQWYWSYEFVNPDFIEENEEDNFFSSLITKHQNLEKTFEELQDGIKNLNNKQNNSNYLQEERTKPDVTEVQVQQAVKNFYQNSQVFLNKDDFDKLVMVVKNLDSPSSADFSCNYLLNHLYSKGPEFTTDEFKEWFYIWDKYQQNRIPEDFLKYLHDLAFDAPEEFLNKMENEKENQFLQGLRDVDLKMLLDFGRQISPNNDLVTQKGFEDVREYISKKTPENYTEQDHVEAKNYEYMVHVNHDIAMLTKNGNFYPKFIDAVDTLSRHISKNNSLPQSSDYGILNYEKNAKAIRTLCSNGFEQEARNFLQKLRNINFVYNEGVYPRKAINPFYKENWDFILKHVENWKREEPEDLHAWKDLLAPENPSDKEANDRLTENVFKAYLVETKQLKTPYFGGTIDDHLAYHLNTDKMSFHVNYGFRDNIESKWFESNVDFEKNFFYFADLNRIYNEKLIDEMLNVVEGEDKNEPQTSNFHQQENEKANEEAMSQAQVQYDVFKAFLDRLVAPKSDQSEDLIITYDSYMLSEDDISNDAERLLKVDNPLYLPTRQHVRLLVTSSDVLHSWAVPNLGIKIDACPGRLNQTTTYIYRSGVYFGQCSEICGVNHGFMPINVHAVDLGVESDADAISLNAAKYIFKMLIVQMFA